MLTANAPLRFAHYHPDHTAVIVDIFCRAVHHIDDAIYTPAQKRAWAPLPADLAFWQRRLQRSQPWLALLHQRVAGFIELDNNGYIDCLYVDPDFQGQGIGHVLLAHVMAEAQRRDLSQLTCHASRCAKALFEALGFQQQQACMVRRRGEVLVNYAMQLEL